MIHLEGSTVHVWRAALDVDDAVVAALEAMLQPEELAQSRRFRLARDRCRFIVCHGRLRQILAAYLDRSPETLRFQRGPHGKLELAEREAPERLEFSLARSADLALYAVARGRRVGVDVERVHADFDWRPVAARYQTPRQRERLDALPAERRLVAFFEWWARTEAYVKACGEGIAAGEARMSTEPDPRWSITALDAAPGFAAALAVEVNVAGV